MGSLRAQMGAIAAIPAMRNRLCGIDHKRLRRKGGEALNGR
jgi:hypothetical protein